MLENCRVCCETTQGTNAKNLFDSEQSVFLHHIELLTGEWLTYEENAPTYICICCEQDLKVAAAFRERCIKTQRKLRKENICTSPTAELFDKIKLENSMHESDEYSEADYADYTDDYADFELDCAGAELVDDDVEDSVDGDDDFDDDDDFIINPTDIKDEKESIDDKNELDAQSVAEKLKMSPTKQPVDSEDRKGPEPTVKRKQLINWRVLTEEQVKEMKRLVRRRDYVCDQCGRRFTDPSNLKLHVIRHSGIKNYECKECNAKFYTPHLLKRHSLLHKNSPSMFACQYCERKFFSSDLRQQHEKSHFKERLFDCTYCDKSFFSKAQQKGHELVHTRIRKYHCELCDLHFLRGTHLKRHYRSKIHKNLEQQKK